MYISARCMAIAAAFLSMPVFATAKGITYDCDTAADHFSELVLPAGSAPFVASGNVRLNAMAESREFLPVVRVQIATPADPGSSPDEFAGFALTVVAKGKAKLPPGVAAVQMLSYTAKGKEDEVIPPSMLVTPGTVQPFSLAYDGSNVKVTLGSETRDFPLKAAEPVVRVICSTGEFLITDLTIAPTR